MTPVEAAVLDCPDGRVTGRFALLASLECSASTPFQGHLWGWGEQDDSSVSGESEDSSRRALEMLVHLGLEAGDADMAFRTAV